MELSPEDQLILSSIKIHLSTKELEQVNLLIPQIQNWEYLIITIIDRGLGPLLFNKLSLLTNSSLIPENVKTNLQQVYYKTFSRSTILYEHFRIIAEAFTSKGISVIALKGVYLSEWLYQDISLRQFSDIDLLVKKEDALTCLSILEAMGYIPYEFKVAEIVKQNTEIVHYPPMIFNGVSIEIHIKLHKNTELYDMKVDEIWENSIPVSINHVPVLTLNAVDLLIYLCIHLDKHFNTGHVQFTCFSDITNLLDRNAEIINWELFTETCRRYNCVNIVFKYIVLVNSYMNAQLPDFIIQKFSYLLTENDEQLFCKFLQGYTDPSSNIPTHLVILKQLFTFSDKVKYVRGVFFPPNALMIQIYHIKYPIFIPFYYPYRYFSGMKWLIRQWKKR